MRSLRIVGCTVLLAGCASAGSGGPFPTSGDPYAAITAAEREIASAQQVGADSLAGATLEGARQHLATAQSELSRRDLNRAAVRARQAEAQARYARAEAERVLADRARAEARGALEALPPGGNDR